MLLSTPATDTSRVLPILLVTHCVLSADPALMLFPVARTWDSAETLLWQQTCAYLRSDWKHGGISTWEQFSWVNLLAFSLGLQLQSVYSASEVPARRHQ